MRHCRSDVLNPRFAVQFEAEPRVLAGLRNTVAGQLGAWGVPAAAVEVQLAVNELVTNVITHVGEGQPATLLLALKGDRLRVGVRDMSPVVPSPQSPLDDSESGRGLLLIKELSAAWGVTSYSAGKEIWCELLLPDTHLARHRTALALAHYASSAGISGDLIAVSVPAREEAATGLITDLLRHLASYGCDPDDILDRAQMRFEAARKEACR